MNECILCFPKKKNAETNLHLTPVMKCKAMNAVGEITHHSWMLPITLRRLSLWLPFGLLNDNLIALFLPSKSLHLSQLFPCPALLPSAPL